MRCKGSWLTVGGSGGEAPATSRVTWAGRQQCHAQRQGGRRLQRIPTGGVLLGSGTPRVFPNSIPLGLCICERRSPATVVQAGERGPEASPTLHLSCSLPIPRPDSGGTPTPGGDLSSPLLPGFTKATFSVSQDMFAAAVSLVTGKILYISDQVASIFRCKRDTFYDAKFVEFLAPHDVSVFHSSTTPYKLPPWSDRRQAGEGPSPWAAWEEDSAQQGGGRAG